MGAATQSIPGFFPNYAHAIEIAAEIGLWLSIGLFARCYLIYTEYPDTFEGLKQSIAGRPLERWLARLLHHPIDAIFTRIWVGNSIAMIPLTLLLVLPSTVNYFVLAAYGVALLLVQFPHDLADHVNIHTRLFQPRTGAPERLKRLLRGLQLYFEYVLALFVARAPNYYRVQHVYVHHVEDNGLLDSQTTAPLDRTSFLDFSRHAFKQGLDLVSGVVDLPLSARQGQNAADARSGARPCHLVGDADCGRDLQSRGRRHPVRLTLHRRQHAVAGGVLAARPGRSADHPSRHTATPSTTPAAEHGNLGNDYHVEHHARPGRHWAAYYEDYCKEAGCRRPGTGRW